MAPSPQPRSQTRALLTNLAISIVVEMVGAAFARRLRRGRQSGEPDDATTMPGAVRLLVGALSAELIQTAVSELWWQRRRTVAAIEHPAAVASVSSGSGHLPLL